VISYADDKKDGGEGVATTVAATAAARDGFKKTADEWTSYDSKVEEGRKEGEKLTQALRALVLYVIDQTLFGKLKPKRAELVKDKAAAVDAAGAAGGEPQQVTASKVVAKDSPAERRAPRNSDASLVSCRAFSIRPPDRRQ
jgi:hypothetical protein